MQVNELKTKYENLQDFLKKLKFSLKKNEKKCYMQPNAKYFCLFFSNNLKNYYENKCNLSNLTNLTHKQWNEAKESESDLLQPRGRRLEQTLT